jgi:hypothetical protein
MALGPNGHEANVRIAAPSASVNLYESGLDRSAANFIPPRANSCHRVGSIHGCLRNLAIPRPRTSAPVSRICRLLPSEQHERATTATLSLIKCPGPRGRFPHVVQRWSSPWTSRSKGRSLQCARLFLCGSLASTLRSLLRAKRRRMRELRNTSRISVSKRTGEKPKIKRAGAPCALLRDRCRATRSCVHTTHRKVFVGEASCVHDGGTNCAKFCGLSPSWEDYPL